MSQQGPLSPGTTAVDTSVGTNTWFSTDNAKVSDDTRTNPPIFSTNSNVIDYSVRLVKGGVISGTDKARAPASVWPGSDTYISYGGSSDVWGLSLSASDINSSDFGFVIACQAGAEITNYIKVTNFGFSISGSAVINGIVVEVEQLYAISGKTGNSVAFIDHIRTTVHYTDTGTTTSTSSTSSSTSSTSSSSVSSSTSNSSTSNSTSTTTRIDINVFPRVSIT